MSITYDVNFNMIKMRYELIRDEGVRFTPYKDSMGNLTIGVGHLLPLDKPTPKVWPRDVIYSTLDKDILIAYDAIKGEPWYIALEIDSQRRALINMRFNLGNRLNEFHNFLDYLSKKQFTLAANNLILSKYHMELPERVNRILVQIRST